MQNGRLCKIFPHDNRDVDNIRYNTKNIIDILCKSVTWVI